MGTQGVANVYVRKFGWIIVVAAGFVVFECAAYVSLRYAMPKSKAAYLVYTPPTRPDSGEHTRYMRTRDPVLGWPHRIAEENKSLDASGSRHVPAYPHPGDACVSLYGDSYVYASDVDDNAAWGNVLSARLSCRVANFGVPAFGTDQALLRFMQATDDESPVSILGIFTANFKRNVNQYRYFISGHASNRLVFKPRFTLSANGSLHHVRIPALSLSDFDELDEIPGRHLQHEFFVPGTRYGAVPLEFPYGYALFRVLRRPEVAHWLYGRPDWHDFVQRGHASGSLEVTVAIAKRFMDICTERGKRCFTVIFPSRNVYEFFSRTGTSPLQVFLDELDALDIASVDLTHAFAAALGERSLCEVLAKPGRCAGHYNGEGNRIVADAVYEALQANEKQR